MGFGGISPFQLIIILLIVLLLFGGKRLRGLGSDLGSAIKGFRKSMDDSNTDQKNVDQKLQANQDTTQTNQAHAVNSTKNNTPSKPNKED